MQHFSLDSKEMNGDAITSGGDSEPARGEETLQAETETSGPPVLPKKKKLGPPKESPPPKAERSDARADSLFFPMLLATKRTLEKEARAARISSLTIV